jgi:hypothetical protein
MTPRGSKGLPDGVKELLDLGCVGMIMAYQGNSSVYPENAPGTNCYLEESLARSRRCPHCCRNFVFAKQGKWVDGIPPGPDKRTGKVWNGAIAHNDGHFNYIIYFPSTRSYAWMNYGSNDARRFGSPQMAMIWNVPYNDPVNYPNTIWCSTCKLKTGGR